MLSQLKKTQVLIKFAAMAVVLLAAVGCADSPKSNLPRPTTNITGQLQPVPYLPSQSATAAYGTYTGTLYKTQFDGSTLSQPFSLVLSQSSSGYGATGAFSSSGIAGNFNFSMSMDIGLSSYQYMGISYYSFLSSRLTDSGFSGVPFKIQLIVALANSGTQFDPTQSSISIKDCGFSDSCTNYAEDVSFGADLGKR